MNVLLVLYNNFTYSLSVVIVLSTLIHGTRRDYVAAFSLIAVAGLLFTLLVFAPNWIMPVNTVLLTGFFAWGKGIVEYRRTGFYCLTAVTLSWYAIVSLSSLIMLIVPGWLYSNGYNLFIGGVLVAAAGVVKAKESTISRCKEIADEGHAIVLALVILLFFSFVLPLYYPAIYAQDAQQWGVFVLSFMVVLAITGLMLNRIKDLAHQRESLAAQVTQQQAYAGQVQVQYERVVTLRHYYTKLYHSLVPFIRDNDMKGLRYYFETNIAPIHQEQVLGGNPLSNVHNKLIRNLLDVTIGQVTALGGITLDIDIAEKLCLPDLPENMALNIFEIMSNLIDNALRALDGQAPGLLRIGLHDTDGQFCILIANSLKGDLDIERIYSQQQGGDGHGYGLKRVREIVFQYPHMEHFTYKGGMFGDKTILVQQIKIGRSC